MNVNFEPHSKAIRYAATSVSEALRKQCFPVQLEFISLLLIVWFDIENFIQEVVRTFECEESIT